MSSVTEQLSVLENKLDAVIRQQNLVHDRVVLTNGQTEEIRNLLRTDDSICDMDEVIESQADYIHFLEDEIAIYCEEEKRLRRKNKKLKKKVKMLSDYIDEIDNVELT